MAVYSRAETHLIINSYYNSFLDTISPYTTLLGNGITIVAVTLLLAFIRYRYALMAGISFIIVTIITQVLRQTIFHGLPRPAKFFEGIHELHLVPGVYQNSINTFPSGHTAGAFALYFCLTLIVKNNWLKFLFFILALLTAYSRIYLSQHFFADVYESSLIGMLIALGVYYFVQRISKNWPEQSLRNIFKKS